MASELNGFSEAILGQLSQIGIEILNEKEKGEPKSLVPKAIYEITKETTNNKNKKNFKKEK